MFEAKGVLAVIPARFGSSRFPGKPLAPILGVPLILRVAERVALVLPKSAILIATDDNRIADVVRASGFSARLTSSACPTGTDRVWEAVRDLDFDIILNIQGDEPLIEGKDIETVISRKRELPENVINAMCPIVARRDIDNPNVPKVVVTGQRRMVYISRAPVPVSKVAQVAGSYYRQVCIYAFSRNELEAFGTFGERAQLEAREDIEILRFLELDIPVTMVEVEGASIAVDEPGDIARVERRLSR